MEILAFSTTDPLMARAKETLCAAFEQSGAHILWTMKNPSLFGRITDENTKADVAIIDSSQSSLMALRCAHKVIRVNIAACKTSWLAQIVKRSRLVSKRNRLIDLYIFPELSENILSNTDLETIAKSLQPLALQTLPNIPVPIWMHSMPKDLPTAIILPKNEPYKHVITALSSISCNIMYLTDTMQDIKHGAQSNVYLKPRSILNAAFDFAQLGVVDDDPVLAYELLRRGLPVVYITDGYRTPFTELLDNQGIGIATHWNDAADAMRMIFETPAYLSNANRFSCIFTAMPQTNHAQLITQTGPSSQKSCLKNNTGLYGVQAE